MEIFLDWMYFKIVPRAKTNLQRELIHLLDSDLGDLVEAINIETYIFADRYDVPVLRAVLLKSAFDFYTVPVGHNAPTYALVQMAFDRLPEPSTYLKLIVDLFARFTSKDECRSQRDQERKNAVSKDFFIRLLAAKDARIERMQSAIQNYGELEAPQLDLCEYHEHNNEEEKTECRRKSKSKANGASYMFHIDWSMLEEDSE